MLLFRAFIVWAIFSDIGLLVLAALFDPLFGLGAFLLTLGVVLALMLGWIPLPRESLRRPRRPVRRD